MGNQQPFFAKQAPPTSCWHCFLECNSLRKVGHIRCITPEEAGFHHFLQRFYWMSRWIGLISPLLLQLYIPNHGEICSFCIFLFFGGQSSCDVSHWSSKQHYFGEHIFQTFPIEGATCCISRLKNTLSKGLKRNQGILIKLLRTTRFTSLLMWHITVHLKQRKFR